MQNNYDCWYVLFVKTGFEEEVAEQLRDELNATGFSPFIPTKVSIYRRKGQKSDFKQICFPGYIFIQSTNHADEFRRIIFPVVYKIKNAYRFLHYGDDRNDIEMCEDEKNCLHKLFGDEFCIEKVKLFKEGEVVKILSGPFVGCESRIKKISSKKKEAVLSLEKFRNIIDVTISIDLIDTI